VREGITGNGARSLFKRKKEAKGAQVHACFAEFVHIDGEDEKKPKKESQKTGAKENLIKEKGGGGVKGVLVSVHTRSGRRREGLRKKGEKPRASLSLLTEKESQGNKRLLRNWSSPNLS